MQKRKPDVLVQADPTPCNALANHNTPNEFPNANNKVERNIMQKPVNIGIV